MHITEKCFFFPKNCELVQKYHKEIEKHKIDTKIITDKAAEVFGIENTDTNINLSTYADILINSKTAQKYNFYNKVLINVDKDFTIHDENNNYLGQWCTLKRNTKEYKELEKLKEQLGKKVIPDIRRTILGNIFISCKYADIKIDFKDYSGIYCVINNDQVHRIKEDNLKQAITIPLSEFYKRLEEIDSEEEKC